MPKAMIFDLDGTILNTLNDLGHACNRALRHFGYPEHELKAYEQMVGNGFTLLVRRSLPEAAAETLPLTRFLEIQAFAKDAYAAHMCEDTKPYDGLPEVIAQLAARGLLLGVLSNKPEAMTQHLVATYYPDIPFYPVCGGRDDKPLKPDPTRLLEMLSALSCEPKDCLLVGDSNVDMQTAQAAHVHPIGVAWGFRGAKELRSFGAERLIEQPGELLTLLA